MSKSRSPSTRWTSEHGFHRRQGARQARGGKRVYRSWWSARVKCAWINLRNHEGLHEYSCYWGANYRDGETAQKHWHLGHESPHDMWGY